jgi:hypothetical protein
VEPIAKIQKFVRKVKRGNELVSEERVAFVVVPR